ncbi:MULTISPECIES: SE1832 family protein [Bacillaceae]|uniref:SE1832 family protein n=1 Tax=Bacillaceae TaxID=186817 RepID=UPI000BFDE1BC|nr:MULTISPECIES: SE1832 family protein [Bacillaceae]PGT81061.1 hypothetical protein COD11_18970 [Bacillus sp. AFS040349]UGB32183.1 hypothetical protein LPC09_06885 [Metabacillus sp. B2-18]
MSSQDIQQIIDELKMEYIRVQGDIEKLEATGHSTEKLESKLLELEEELSKIRTQLKNS